MTEPGFQLFPQPVRVVPVTVLAPFMFCSDLSEMALVRSGLTGSMVIHFEWMPAVIFRVMASLRTSLPLLLKLGLFLDVA